MNLPEKLGALREREFRLLFIGQSVSLVGDGMVGVALSFAVLDLTGSVSKLGFVLAARSVGFAAFLLAGGVFADRLPRRAVMVGADVIRCGSQSLTAALLISGDARIWQLLALQAVNGSANAFFYPASTGLIPSIVSPQRLQEANALRGLSMSAAEILGPALAGALVVGVGPGWALAVDAGTFAVSAVFLAQLRLPPHVRIEAQPFLRDLHEGWREFSSRTWVWVIVLAASFGNMTAAPFFVLGAAISKTDLGGAGAWALILACFSAGSFVGGLVTLHIRPRRPLLVGSLTVSLFAVPTLLLAAKAPLATIAAGALLAGCGLMIFNALWETALQQHVPSQALSRVSAYDWFGSIAIQPLGFALVGPVALAIGDSETLWLAGACMIASLGAVLTVPSVRNLRAVGRDGSSAILRRADGG